MKLMAIYLLFGTLLTVCAESNNQRVCPQAVKFLMGKDQQIKNATDNSKKQSEPKFGFLKCRADAQKWTADPFDQEDMRNLSTNKVVMVNGQFRSTPRMTRHATVGELLKRAYEMEVCTQEDSEFEKQFATYSSMARAYGEECSFRYMYFLTTHHLDEQFTKEDAEANK